MIESLLGGSLGAFTATMKTHSASRVWKPQNQSPSQPLSILSQCKTAAKFHQCTFTRTNTQTQIHAQGSNVPIHHSSLKLVFEWRVVEDRTVWKRSAWDCFCPSVEGNKKARGQDFSPGHLLFSHP